MKHRVRQDKPVSVEVLKLLGVPFTWGASTLAGKFVHTSEGPELWVRSIGIRPLIYGPYWEVADISLHYYVFGGDFELYLVELDDELEASDASDR